MYTFAVLFFAAASVAAIWMLCVAWREARRGQARATRRPSRSEFTTAEVRNAFEKFAGGRKAGGDAVRMSGLSVFLFVAVLAGGASARAQDPAQGRRSDAAEAREQESRERKEAERRQKEEAQRQPGVRCNRYYGKGKS